MASLVYEAYNRALYEHRDDTPSYEQQEYVRSYAIGTDHQYETVGRDLSTLKQIHVNDSEENRREFNRRFNDLIHRHSEAWHNDKTPPAERNASFYAHRYRMFFHSLMLLLETFPDVGDRKLYWSIVHAWQSYRELCAYHAGMTPADYWKHNDPDADKKKDEDYRWRFCS